MLLLLAACGDPSPAPSQDDPSETATDTSPPTWDVHVRVTLDGVPAPDTLVMQGGGRVRYLTDAAGEVEVEVDTAIVGDLMVLAAHTDARIDGVEVEGPGSVEIALVRFDTTDNPAYVFADPGPEAQEESNSSQCVHCHVTLHADWYGSPHRTAASNPVVHDLYGGTAATFATAARCDAAGGTFGPAVEPGTGDTVDRCLLGAGVRTTVDGYGGCADCHAPGIDGALGSRDLLDATGVSYDAGVHCDICHHVESVDMDAAPGVAGRLHVVRPSEPSPSPILGPWAPLLFGPLADVVNPLMGSVLRETFHETELCGACHEQAQASLVPGVEVDRARWPDGVLPVHSTWSEWEASPMNPAASCQSCHMPPEPEVGNSADLYNEFDVLVGVTGGWERPPGEVRAHVWSGPRQRESGMLESAAHVAVQSTVDAGVLVARVTVKNVGPGHALPTGEPLRSVLLLVEATCDGEALRATGGDAVPDFGGALDTKTADEDWSRWPGATLGDVVRVVRRTGAWVDYVGYGPFGDGRFDAAAKGMPEEQVVGEATILAVDGDAVELSSPLPEGDIAYRVDGVMLPADGDAARAWAGAPGFAFARVLTGADGGRMVPHFLAVDVASDNRLLPGASWTSTHVFSASCAAPVVHATLVHRAWPLALARERGWSMGESVMAEVRR